MARAHVPSADGCSRGNQRPRPARRGPKVEPAALSWRVVTPRQRRAELPRWSLDGRRGSHRTAPNRTAPRHLAVSWFGCPTAPARSSSGAALSHPLSPGLAGGATGPRAVDLGFHFLVARGRCPTRRAARPACGTLVARGPWFLSLGGPYLGGVRRRRPACCPKPSKHPRLPTLPTSAAATPSFPPPP